MIKSEHFSASTFTEPYLHQFFTVMLFGTNLHHNLKIYAKTAPSKSVIWDEFSEQHQHQSIKKYHI